MSHALYSKYLHVRARISKINWLAYFFFAISKIGTYLLNTHFYYLLFFFFGFAWKNTFLIIRRATREYFADGIYIDANYKIPQVSQVC